MLEGTHPWPILPTADLTGCQGAGGSARRRSAELPYRWHTGGISVSASNVTVADGRPITMHPQPTSLQVATAPPFLVGHDYLQFALLPTFAVPHYTELIPNLDAVSELAAAFGNPLPARTPIRDEEAR